MNHYALHMGRKGSSFLIFMESFIRIGRVLFEIYSLFSFLRYVFSCLKFEDFGKDVNTVYQGFKFMKKSLYFRLRNLLLNVMILLNFVYL